MSKSQFVFGATPTVRMRRSRFDLSHGVKTSMNVGTLYPISVTEVIPGDTFKFKESDVVRLSSAFLRPVMDNCYLDKYYFFVPHRIVYDRFEETMGENKKGAWANTSPPDIPTFQAIQKVSSGTVADYMGLPVGEIPTGETVLPFRGFAMIYNEWFRNENVIDPMNIQKGGLGISENLNNNPWSPSNYMGQLPKVGKRKDYFTSALPSPQKGSAVELNLGDTAPVVFGATQAPVVTTPVQNVPTGVALSFYSDNGGLPNQSDIGLNSSGSLVYKSNVSWSDVSNSFKLQPRNLSAVLSGVDGVVADLSQATAANVNDLRFAFQLQKMLERDARGGTRYREYLLSHFGVSNPDARMQIPEFLGGHRTPLNVQQVAQTNTQQKDSSGTLESPLASLGAMSQSVGNSRFTKSFTEHGYVFCVACIRQFHTYQQGINKMWTRKSRNDFYDPLFANIGEQPIYRSEIYGLRSANPSGLQSDVFGYNEAWADYRYKPSLVTGEMRSNIENSLDVWHFADNYANAPVLGQEFIEETSKFFDRTVAVPSESQDNFIVDFYFDVAAYRVMPVYSVPGLIDHH